MQPLRGGLVRFLRVYAAFFLCISALVLAAFALGTLPSGGLRGVAEGVGFLAAALALVYLAVRVIRPLRRKT